MLHFDKTPFVDSSQYSLQIQNNKVETASAIKKFGAYAAFFNGSSSNLTIPNNPIFEWGLGDFSIDCWLYGATPTKDSFIYSSDVTGGFFFGFNTSGTRIGIGRAGTAWDVNIAFTWDINTWMHLAVTRQNGTVKIFKNGVQLTSVANAISYGLNGGNLSIGSHILNGGYFINGIIDELRVSNVARWTVAFTPPTSAYSVSDNLLYPINSNTQLLLHLNGSFEDSSNYNRQVVSTGATFSDISHFGDKAASGFAPTKGIRLTNNTAYNFGSNDFTIDGWFKFTEATSVYQPLFDRRGTKDYSGLVLTVETNNTLHLYISNNDAATSWIINMDAGAITPYLNKYTHIAAVRKGNIFTIYINGIGIISTTSTIAINNVSVNPTIGVGSEVITTGLTNQHYMHGYIDEFHISNEAIWSENFTPPLQPYGGEDSIVLPYSTPDYVYGTLTSRYQWYVAWYKYPANVSTITSSTYIVINSMAPNGDNVDLNITIHSTNNITRVSESGYAGNACPTFTYKTQPNIYLHNEVSDLDILVYNMELSTDVPGNPSGNVTPTYGSIVHDQTINVSVPRSLFSDEENIWTFKVQDIITIVNTSVTQTNIQDYRVFKFPKLFNVTARINGVLYQAKNITIRKNGQLFDVSSLGVRKNGAIV